MKLSKILLLSAVLLTALENTANAARQEEKIGDQVSEITHALSKADLQDPKFTQFMLDEIPVPAAFQAPNVLSRDVPIREKLIFSDMYSQLKQRGTPGSMMAVPNYLLKLVPEHLYTHVPLGRQVMITQEVADKLAEHLCTLPLLVIFLPGRDVPDQVGE